ncbi:MAG: hypothetical protein ABJA98_03875 [Acidobacteriota bacterium]
MRTLSTNLLRDATTECLRDRWVFLVPALTPDERHSRMRHMRRVVREHNVYRWAAELIGDLADVRFDTSQSGAAL